MLAALVAGHTDPYLLADLAKGRWRDTREPLVKALEGRVKPHQRVVLTELLGQIDSLDATIARFDVQIQQRRGPFDEAVGLRDTIPGVARHTAETLVAEIGTERGHLPSADHVASWAGVAPGTYESAGKRLSGKTHKGNRFLRPTLVQAAHAAARTKGPLCVRSTGAWPRAGAGSARSWRWRLRSWCWLMISSNARSPTAKPVPTTLTGYGRRTRPNDWSHAEKVLAPR
jgi:transposase